MASRASAKLLRVLRSGESSFDEEWAGICNRRSEEAENVEEEARKIIEGVRAGGDRELRSCIKKRWMSCLLS